MLNAFGQMPGHAGFRADDADIAVFADGRAIVKGVRDAAQARGVYAKYVGA